MAAVKREKTLAHMHNTNPVPVCSDNYGSAFWMAVVKGSKTFRLLNQSDTEYMYPTESEDVRRGKGFAAFFEVDAFRPDLIQHPVLNKMSIPTPNPCAGIQGVTAAAFEFWEAKP